MLEKTTHLSMFAQQVGLKISEKKTEVMMLNVPNPPLVKVNEEQLPTTKKFTYLDTTVQRDGRAGSDIRNHLNKVKIAFRMLNKKSSQYSTETKLRLCHSCVLSALLYILECWRTIESDLNKLATFHTKKNPTKILDRDHLQ